MIYDLDGIWWCELSVLVAGNPGQLLIMEVSQVDWGRIVIDYICAFDDPEWGRWRRLCVGSEYRIDGLPYGTLYQIGDTFSADGADPLWDLEVQGYTDATGYTNAAGNVHVTMECSPGKEIEINGSSLNIEASAQWSILPMGISILYQEFQAANAFAISQSMEADGLKRTDAFDGTTMEERTFTSWRQQPMPLAN